MEKRIMDAMEAERKSRIERAEEWRRCTIIWIENNSTHTAEELEGKTNEELRMLEWEIKEANEPKTEIVKETEAEAKARQEACDRFRARFGGGMMNIKSKKRKRS